MIRMRSFIVVLLFVLIFFAGSECQAVIYKYVNAKGIPTFADDMQKIPEEFRQSAVIVSGVVADEKAEEEKAKLDADARARSMQPAGQVVVEEPLGKRLIRSGIAVALFVVIMVVLANLHGLDGHAGTLLRIRLILSLLLFVFIGLTHAKDIAGLFGKAGTTVTNPIASIQEQSAERGKKAADAYKSIDKVLEQKLNDRASEEEARLREMEKKFDEAEKAK